jgi:hypothetical protein
MAQNSSSIRGNGGRDVVVRPKGPQRELVVRTDGQRASLGGLLTTGSARRTLAPRRLHTTQPPRRSARGLAVR